MSVRFYIDGSGSHDQPALFLAGYVASDEQWLSFTDEWKDWLRMVRQPYEKVWGLGLS